MKHENNKIYNINNMKGFTLLELIIAFALAGIIAAVAFSLNTFSNRVLNVGEKKYSVQSEINLASEQITRNIRFATGVQLLDSSYVIPDVASISNNDSYLYIESEAGKQVLKLRDKTGTKNLITLDTLNFSFLPEVSNRSVSFMVEGTYQGQQFQISSDVAPQNMLVREKTVENSSGVKLRIQREPMPTPVPGLTVTASSMTGELGGSASGSLTASGGSGPYKYTVSSSSRLPYGVTLNQNNGQLGGSPIEAGKLSVTFIAEDSSLPVKTAALTQDVEITDSTYDSATDPYVENVNIDYNSAAGECTVSYNYSSGVDNEDEGPTQVSWYRSSSADGSSLEFIETDTYPDIEYTVNTSLDEGKYLFVKVIPYDISADVHDGYPVYSRQPVLVSSNSNTEPVAIDPIITGTAIVGNELTGSFTYSDAENNDPGIHIYKWYRASRNNGSDKTVIPGATSDKYMLTTYDSGKYIYFEVTPVSMVEPKVGVPKMSAHVGKVKDN